MKVKMLTLSSGPKGHRHAGRVYDVPDKEAKAMIEGRYATEATPEDIKAEAILSRRKSEDADEDAPARKGAGKRADGEGEAGGGEGGGKKDGE